MVFIFCAALILEMHRTINYILLQKFIKKTYDISNQGELSSITATEGRSLSADVAAWNPFEDVQPFNQLTEDHIFGAEFDKIRRGSNASISGVKSRESLVMTYAELPEDPFESAPFSLPSKCV